MKQIIITENCIEISGFTDIDFKLQHLGSCRDVARAALAWGAQRIADDQHKDATGEWENQTTVLD